MFKHKVSEFTDQLEKSLKGGLQTILILQAISKSPIPIYGYKIIQDIKHHTNGVLQLNDGTIYPILKRLEKKKLISSMWAIPAKTPPGTIPKKYYRITHEGQQALRDSITKWGQIHQAFNNAFEGLIQTDIQDNEN